MEEPVGARASMRMRGNEFEANYRFRTPLLCSPLAPWPLCLSPRIEMENEGHCGSVVRCRKERHVQSVFAREEKALLSLTANLSIGCG